MTSTANDSTSTGLSYEVSIYKPFKAGLPNLRTYFASMWRRRELALELARASLKAQQANTVIGQFWLVLNPLFLAGIYYTLIVIVSGGQNRGTAYIAHLLAGLFAYHFISQAISSGANSIVKSGKLITNRAFPRLLLPLTEVVVAGRRFIPTLLVYTIFHLFSGSPLSINQLMAIPAFALIAVFTLGFTSLFATAQVYFRDTQSFLPYVIRMWMYISPVLYYADKVPPTFAPLRQINPLFSLLECWSDALVRGEIAPLSTWLTALSWSAVSLVLGIYVFLSRERDFAVRI